MTNIITWFELPATDLERAATFYRTILGAQFRTDSDGGLLFVADSRAAVSGSIIKNDKYVPTATGTVVYLNAGTPDNLDAILSRVVPAGGQILMPKTHLGDPGHIAMILDSEGNRVGLHSSPWR